MHTTKLFPRLRTCVLILAAALLPSLSSLASAAALHPDTTDGAHDFDFNFGVWNTHITSYPHPLSGTSAAIELNGTVTVRKVWGGRAALEEIAADGPSGHWEGMTLFLYNPASRQWSQTFVNGKTGIQSGGMIGSFKDGRGTLFAQDTLDGKAVLVRAQWSDITPTSHTYEESYSDDLGATWKPSFIAHKTRRDSVASAPTSGLPTDHHFDFDFGSWKTHSSRLLHPLDGSNGWTTSDGLTVVKKIWGGRANLAEVTLDGPSGPLQLLALRTYNTKTGQWYLNFANARVGTLGVPGAGEFKGGRIDFYDQEPIDGKYVLVRFFVWKRSPTSAASEQAFSVDGGKTWETNIVSEYTRV